MKEKNEKVEKTAVILPNELHEWMKDYQFHKIVKTGEGIYTLQQVWTDAVEALRKNHPEVKPRPDSFKLREKEKNERKASAAAVTRNNRRRL